MSQTMKIPMSCPDVSAKEIALVNQVLSSPSLSIGPMVTQFENVLSRYLGLRHAIAVSSGTAGLHLAVIAAGIEPGDEVITTPFSFVSSANCILYQRGQPVFVDIDLGTLNIDVDRIEERITPRTKAILAVHVFGQPCRADRLVEIARRRGLILIEDACEAIGAEFRGRKTGTFGHSSVFAFYPNKQMTTGEGGVVLTDDEDWARLLRSLRNQGRDEDGTWLRHVRLGYNYRLDEMSAALGLGQLERIEELLVKRERVAAMYSERLGSIDGVVVPYVAPETTRMSWFVYVVRLAPDLDRDWMIDQLAEVGVPSRPYFSPIHLQPFYAAQFGYGPGDFPVTETAARSTLALPFHGNLSEAEVEYVGDSLQAAIHRSPRLIWKVPHAAFPPQGRTA
jgi:perosamine synthetase